MFEKLKEFGKKLMNDTATQSKAIGFASIGLSFLGMLVSNKLRDETIQRKVDEAWNKKLYG